MILGWQHCLKIYNFITPEQTGQSFIIYCEFNPIHYSNVIIIGMIRLQILSNIPVPICLRIKFTLNLLFLDFIADCHFFLLFFIFVRTLSKRSLFSTLFDKFSFVIRMKITSRKSWIDSSFALKQKKSWFSLRNEWKIDKIREVFLIFFYSYQNIFINILLYLCWIIQKHLVFC